MPGTLVAFSVTAAVGAPDESDDHRALRFNGEERRQRRAQELALLGMRDRPWLGLPGVGSFGGGGTTRGLSPNLMASLFRRPFVVPE
jgi:hypothetical protein